jgi:hypothetical protein
MKKIINYFYFFSLEPTSIFIITKEECIKKKFSDFFYVIIDLTTC